MTGKTWNIPADAQKPARANAVVKERPRAKSALLDRLTEEMQSKTKGGIYHKVQVELTYNSNHIEGSRLSMDQTCLIFETATVGVEGETLRVDDIVETSNHFRAIDYIIRNADALVTEGMIKELHRILKTGTTDASKDWFRVGEYKLLPNEVAGRRTSLPEKVAQDMGCLLREYGPHREHTLDDLMDFHVRFEHIHPFQDGNGRVGRLIPVSYTHLLRARPLMAVHRIAGQGARGRGVLKAHKPERNAVSAFLWTAIGRPRAEATGRVNPTRPGTGTMASKRMFYTCLLYTSRCV